LKGTAEAQEIAAALRDEGAAIVEDVLEAEALDALNAELAPWIARCKPVEDEFSGLKTQRLVALVARSPLARDLIMNPLMRAAGNAFLGPYAERLILHVAQLIRIGPKQGSQMLHRDRVVWGACLPPTIEPQFTTLWALDDFTADNGATQVVPGSQGWEYDRAAEDDEILRAEMSRGSVLVYSGSVLHGGGQNITTDGYRSGIVISYCLAWLRQEENQYLSCPPQVAKDLDPELQDLLGYTDGQYGLGYFSEPFPREGDVTISPPETAVGRMPKSWRG